MTARIECIHQNCNCECYVPSSPSVRVCETCNHGWVLHAIGRLTTQTLLPRVQVIDVVHFNIVFDIGSLILYGTQAVPIRLKIILDRLFSILKHEEVLQVLHGLSWTYEDYARGYILQCDGKVLEKWIVASKEEENLIIQQCLYFEETKLIAEAMLHQEQKKKNCDVYLPTSQESDIRNFIQRLNSTSSVVNSNPQTSPNFLTPNCYSDPDIHQSHISHSSLTTTPPPFNTQQFIHPVSVGATALDISTSSQVDNARVSSSTLITASDGEVPTKMLKTTHYSVASSSCGNTLLARMELPSSINKPYSTSALLAARIMKRLRRPPMSLTANKLTNSLRLLYSVNPVGAKQVTCNACGKAFYNKGTWKIHYSSVHLKEKHKCTIDGCNMYFSSQRSRNRHSANPNPKIHSDVPKLCMKLSGIQSILFESRNNRILDKNADPPTLIGYHKMLPSNTKLRPKDKTTSNSSHGGIYYQNTTETPSEHIGATTMHFSVVTDTQTAVNINTALTVNGNFEDRKKSRKPLNPIKVEQSDKNEYDNGSVLYVKQACSKRKSNTPTKCPISCNEYFSGEDISNSEEEEIEKDTKFVGDIDPVINRDTLFPSPDNLTVSKENVTHTVTHTINKEIIDNNMKDGDRHSSINFPHDKNEGFDLEKMGKDYFAKYLGDDANKECSNIHGALTVNKSIMEKDDCNLDSDDAIASPDSLPNNSLLNYTLNGCYLVRDGIPFCIECNKPFQSIHGVKTHYQNVHLKIMHKCMVTGCSAEFPSKRSRDRHSSNVNLHLRLMEKCPFSDKGTQNVGCQQDPINLNERYCSISSRHVNAASEIDNISSEALLEQYQQDSKSMFSLPISCGRLSVNHNSLDSENFLANVSNNTIHDKKQLAVRQESNEHGTTSSTENETEINRKFLSANKLITDSCMNDNGLMESAYRIYHGPGVVCNICQKVYSTKDTLRVHYKNVHLREMHKCKVPGCNKVFSSVRSRNRHSQNPNLHE